MEQNEIMKNETHFLGILVSLFLQYQSFHYIYRNKYAKYIDRNGKKSLKPLQPFVRISCISYQIVSTSTPFDGIFQIRITLAF